MRHRYSAAPTPGELADLAAGLGGLDDPLGMCSRLLAAAPFAVVIYSARGHARLANRAYERVFGAAIPDGYDIWADEALEQLGVLPLVRRAFGGETVEMPVLWYQPPRAWGPHTRAAAVEPTVIPIDERDGLVHHVAMILRDRTAEMVEHEATDQLRAQADRERQLFEAVLDQLPLAVMVAQSPTGRVLSGNRGSREMRRGAPPAMDSIADYVRGLRAFSLRGEPLAADDLPLARAVRGETVRGHEMRVDFDGQEPVFLRSTAAPIVDAHGAQFAAVAAMEDVTDQRRMQRLFHALVEHGTDVTELLDAAGRVVYVTPSIQSMLGLAPESLVGSDAADGVHPDDVASVASSLALSLERPGIPVAIRVRRRHADGSYRHLDVTRVNALADPAIGAIVTHSRDVTERVVFEEQVRQSQKMEAIGRLAGGIAHDFNNLLGVVLTNASLALGVLPADSPARVDVEEIRDAAERAAALTRQMLAFGRRQVLAPRVLDLNDVVRSVEKLLRRVIGADVELVTRLAPSISPVRVDPTQIEQVIVNLVVNARDAMPSGGRLTIETREAGADGLDASSDTTAVRHVVLAVSDTGVGVSAEVRERMFEPFFTTKGPGRGSGLGLATVFGIVTQSGGRIEVVSEPGAGASFEVHLPASDQPRASDPIAREAGPVPGGSGTVLLAEDDPALRQGTRRILERAGYRVIEAGDGEEALARIENGAERIDALIADLVMPKLGGHALAERAREHHPSLPVLLVSGYSEDVARPAAALGPRARFLPKPVAASALLGALRELLEPER